MNQRLPDVQAAFRKVRGTRDQTANIIWIMEKAREFQKNIYFFFINYAKAFDCVDHNKLRKILTEMGIPDHLICLLRNLYAGQEATVRTSYGTTGSKLGKYNKAVNCHPAYLTYMQSAVCCAWLLSCVRLFATLWTVAHQAPLSTRFSRQEHWSGLPCLSPGDLPNLGIEPTSLRSPALAGEFFITSSIWEAPYIYITSVQSLSHVQHFETP